MTAPKNPENEQPIIDSAVTELDTIRDFIRWAYTHFEGADLFYGHGTNNPWDESVTLVLQSLGLPFDTPDFILASKLVSSEKRMLAKRIMMRVNEKIPVPYITNKIVFCDSEYFVDERVLIPRSPIGELIEKYFEPWIVPEKVNNILDLCTGSGCIAIACSQYFPDAIVDAGDISPECIEVAEINRKKLKQDNVAFYLSDLFDQMPNKKYDIIVSNPPYVDAEDFDEIPDEYHAEPKLGLTSGKDGLDLTRRILKQANNYLAVDGLLIVEVGNSAMALEETYPDTEFTWLEFERGGHGVFLLTKQQLEGMG